MKNQILFIMIALVALLGIGGCKNVDQKIPIRMYTSKTSQAYDILEEALASTKEIKGNARDGMVASVFNAKSAVETQRDLSLRVAEEPDLTQVKLLPKCPCMLFVLEAIDSANEGWWLVTVFQEDISFAWVSR